MKSKGKEKVRVFGKEGKKKKKKKRRSVWNNKESGSFLIYTKG